MENIVYVMYIQHSLGVSHMEQLVLVTREYNSN